MADNTVVNLGTTGDTLRSIDRTSAKTQVVQIDAGGSSAEALVTTSSPLPVNTYGAVLGYPTRVTPQNRMLVNDPVRLIGATYATNIQVGGASVATSGNDYFWNLFSRAGSSATVASVDTNATAIQQATLKVPAGASVAEWCYIRTNRKARHLSAQMSAMRASFKLSGTSVATVAYIGVFTPQSSSNQGVPLDGVCLSIAADGTVSCQTWSAGATTQNVSSGFNGTLGSTYTWPDTNYHTLEILYRNSTVHFLIDTVLLHKISVSTSQMLPTISNHAAASLVSSGADATGRTMTIAYQTVERYGRPLTRFTSAFPAAASSTQLKTGPGTLNSVVLTPGANGNQVNIYDAIGTATNAIYQMTFGAASNLPIALPFGSEGLDFSTGLYLVTTGTVRATVIFD